MKPIFVIALILCTNFANTFGIRMFLQGPINIEEHYVLQQVRQGNSSASTGPTIFTSLNNSDRRTQCLKMVNNTVRFQQVSKHALNLQPKVITDSQNKIVQDVINTPEHVDFTINIQVVQWSGTTTRQQLRGVQCVSGPDNFAIVIKEGSNNNHFYVITQQGVDLNQRSVKFLGFVEEVTSGVDPSTTSQDALDLAFYTSQITLITFPEYALNKSIHNLNKLNQLRACSSAAITIGILSSTSNNILHFVREVEGLNLTITSEDFINPSVVPPGNAIDIIQCAIDTELVHAQFYITNDRAQFGWSFILEKHWGITMKYSVKLKVYNLSGLETLI